MFLNNNLLDSYNCEINNTTKTLMNVSYLNALASRDVWIIIQPFFRRLEPQAAAVSVRRRGEEEEE